ncbi:MAG: hypothetical protein CMA61_01780 [Euryarchaeota archaeon]|nr:hypothetical protein [Euryarchaeota archaeon]
MYDARFRRLMWSIFKRAGDIKSNVVMKKITEGWSPFIIDVRSLGEVQKTGAIPGTNLVKSHDKIRSALKSIPKKGDVLLLCRSGKRSRIAYRTLTASGINAARLYNLKGGIAAWTRNSGRLEKY